jgi:hypothetical protein
MAQIDVMLIPEDSAPPPVGFNAGRVLREAWAEVVRILEQIATALLRLLAYSPLILPPLLVVGLIVWLVVRRVRRGAADGEEGDEA